MLLCPVRGCHQPLTREERRLHCPAGHSFDVARSGYVNLLQPQDRRSKHPGDTVEAVAARRRLHDRGVTAPLLAGIGALAAAAREDVALDAGCGEGFFVGSLARQTGLEAHGVDISTPAIEAAARRYKECHWIVANADRFLPYADGSFSLVLSITSRRNPAEFRRVLKEGGRLLIAVPAPDDLIEIRGKGHDRIARTIEEFAPAFTPVEQRNLTTQADLDAEAVNDLLVSIYRPLQRKPPAAMQVTFSLDLLLFRASQ